MANAYYLLVKAGRRLYSSVPTKYKEDVKALLEAGVVKGELTEEKYQEITGETYNLNGVEA